MPGSKKPVTEAVDTGRRRRPDLTPATIDGNYELKCGSDYGPAVWEADKDDFPGGVRAATLSVHATWVCGEKTTFKVTTRNGEKEYTVDEDNTRAVTRANVKSLHIKCDEGTRDDCSGTWSVTINVL